MTFKEISDDSYGKAFQVLHAPERSLSSEQIALRTASKLAVRGMINGTPLLGRYANNIDERDFAVPGRPHHNALHTSIARLIEEPLAGNAHKTALALAADTVIQMDSKHITSAMRLGFVSSLDDESQLICQMAGKQPSFKDELQHQAIGSYSLLPEGTQQQIRGNLDNPGQFIPEIDAALSRSSAQSQIHARQAAMGRQMG